MFQMFRAARRCFSALALTTALLASPAIAAARTEPHLSVLYAFNGGADGAGPGGLVFDDAGNLYGTASGGGSTDCQGGCGTVFKIAADGTETTLYSFAGGSGDGHLPVGLAVDRDGNVYGTTLGGGSGSYGTVFKLTPDGRETILFNFDAFSSGVTPSSGLTVGKGGEMYGVTQYGGLSNCPNGCGTVFKITRHDRVQTVFAFDRDNGWQPWGGLMADGAGDLYGTTLAGGTGNGGTVFKLDPTGAETVLYNFKGGARDGFLPEAPPQFDAAGNLYGGTYEGPGTGCVGLGCGVIYKLAPDGTETLLHVFNPGRKNFGGAGYAVPGRVVVDEAGNVYGATKFGGASLSCNAPFGCGSIFKVSPAGVRKTLYNFLGPANGDGAYPVFGLIRGKGRNRNTLYGTTATGPNCGDGTPTGGCGMVFKIEE